MKVTIILFTIFLIALMGYSQNSSDKQLEFPDYEWLNNKLPLDTLISYQGDTLVLFSSDKHYVISFLYSYCAPCIAEISWLNKLKQDYSDKNIEFIAISFDSNKEINQLLKAHPFDFKLYHLSMDVIDQKMLTFGYPTNLIVSNRGIVLFQKSGGAPDNEKAKKIYDLLSEEINKLIN